MSRKEVILLVSRALAVIQLVSAVLDLTMLPERLLTYFHHTNELGRLARADRFDASISYFTAYDLTSLASLVLRIAFLLLFALILWQCGPRVERFLLPGAPQVNEAASGAADPEN